MKRKWIILCGLMLWGLLFVQAELIQARIITVDDDGPADFNNIQAAINDSKDGDIIEVQPGIYTGPGNRDIDFKGKAITVRSTDPKNPNIVAATVIDGGMSFNQCLWCCDGCVGCDRHRGFIFQSGEGLNSVLAGLTITRFCAPDKLIWGDLMPVGAGILCEGSSPTIRQCIITDNMAHILGRGGFGGGIYCDGTSNSTIISCTISNNNSYFGAGGIECTRATIADCNIINNSASFGAGGINCSEDATITDCIISSNIGAIGGIDTDGIISHCTIAKNTSIVVGGGGGVHGSPKVDHCIISNNQVSPGPGGGIYLTSAVAVIKNSIITGNLAYSGYEFDEWFDGEGGGIFCQNGTPTIIHCTIAGNTAASNGGGIYGNPTITNSIVWGNNCPNEPQILGMPDITYSNVQGGWLGEGNINVDPCFANPNNGDYHLKSQAGRWDANEGRWAIDEVTSLCIDAGDPAGPIGLEPFPNGGIINMGAYGGTAEASKSYFGEPVCETIIAGDINGDCIVNLKDFALIAFHWLEEH